MRRRADRRRTRRAQLSAGTHTIPAYFVGEDGFVPSTSPALTVVVALPGFCELPGNLLALPGNCG